MKENLKPCPFCGKDPVLEPMSWPDTDYIVKCDNWKCDMIVSTFENTKEVVIKKWNNRKEKKNVCNDESTKVFPKKKS